MMSPDTGHGFRHGVASFDPTATNVLLWTRLDGHHSLRWTVTQDPELRAVVAEGQTETGPEHDWTSVVDVSGLEPGRSYWYRFATDSAESPVGRTRTLPAGPTDRFVLGLACCARFATAPLGAYRALAQRELDLVVHLGDYIYEDAGDKGTRRHQPAHPAVSLDDYRQRMAQMREDPDCQVLHRRHPMTGIWDDHDLADNAWRGGAKAHDPRRDGPWDQRVAAAAQARQEWLPARLTDRDQLTRTWRTSVIGDLAELILPDTRFIGRDLQASEEGAKPLHDPGRSLLGDEQRGWLEARLADTSRPWALLTSGVVVNQITLPVPAPRLINAALPSGYSEVDDHLLHDDQWDGYPVERDRLIASLGRRAEHGARTVLLSGDVHSSWAFEGPVDEHGSAVAVEFTTPAIASEPMGRTRIPGGWRLFDAVASRLDHVRWCDVTERGYGILDVTPASVHMTWWFVDSFDREPSGGEWLGATFRHARSDWPPRLEAATAGTGYSNRPDVRAASPHRPADLDRLRRQRSKKRLIHRSGFAASVGGSALLAVRSALRRYRTSRTSGKRWFHG